MTLLNSPSASKEEPATEELSERNQQKVHALGLTSATALVVGSIVGTRLRPLFGLSVERG